MNKNLKLYDQVSKKYVELNDDKVYWYICGPTVYDNSHLGHARTYITFDILRRVIENYYGKKVTTIMNITDIDDKIINKSIELNKNWKEVAKENEEKFWDDMNTLNVEKPNIITKVSDYINEIIEFIQKLISDNKAYISNSSVYFDMIKYINDGNEYYDEKIEENVDEKGEKRNKKDFALWKKSSEIGFESPFGFGRPGWHIECSTMAINVLKELKSDSRLTIHSGGIDLAFPHHANEIAQSESYLDIKGWIKILNHIGHLNISGQKMSKSLKNYIKIKDYLLNHDAKELRMMFLMIKYNKTVEYSEEFSENAKNIIKKIDNYIIYMKNFEREYIHSKFEYDIELKEIEKIEENIEKYLSDDFDTPKIVEKMQTLIDIGYKSNNLYTNKKILILIKKLYELFGFSLKEDNRDYDYIDVITKIRNDVRNLAKKNKELYNLSDKIRDTYLKDLNIQDLH